MLISGSTREGSTNTAALRAVAELAPPGVIAELYGGLTELPAFVPGDHPPPPAVADLRAQLAHADAVLFCTPEYAGLIPGSLKNLLEWTVGTADLYEKPVAWLNVAAPGRGDGAVAALRTVLGYVGATVVEPICSRITVLGSMIGPDGTLIDAAARAALTTMIGTLTDHLSTRT